MQWINFPDEKFQINGLAFFNQNQPHLYRLPIASKQKVRKEVWQLACAPSGGRIRFSTNSTKLKIRVKYENMVQMFNMPRFGQMGIDVCVDGKFWNILSPESSGKTEFDAFADVEKEMRQICLYLPLYHPVEVLSIGIDDHSEICRASDFSISAPVVYYGSSITQGGCASRPGLSYQAILSRQLNIDFVNLGFSGQGRGESELAEIVSCIKASCYVLDFAQNLETVSQLESVYLPFLKTVRRCNPTKPIICITSIWNDREFYDSDVISKNKGQRQVIRDAVDDMIKSGDEYLTIVEGQDLLGRRDSQCYVDGIHPNDLGFLKIAEGLTKPLSYLNG